MHTGEWPILIDHENRVKGDDRFENLRPLDHSANSHNTDAAYGSVPYRGVSFNKATNKYRAFLMIKGEREYLGNFETAEEASAVYEAVKSGRIYHPLFDM